MDVIQRSKGMEILISLTEKPKFVQEIQTAVGGSATTVEDRINGLVAEGLVESTAASEFPFKRMITLTDKGKIIAGMIKNIDNTLNTNISETKYKWILALLYNMGSIKGITRLEKLLFMLKYDLNGVSQEFFAFSPEKYGPYSEEITYATLEMKKLGLIDVSETIFKPFNSDQEEVRRMDFSLTEYGIEKAKTALKDISKTTQESIEALKKFNDMDLKKLLDHVHKKHPEFVKA